MKTQLLINRLIFEADCYLNYQINSVLHHLLFQRLESSWRGLILLTKVSERQFPPLKVKIRVLQLSMQELAKDLLSGLELEHTYLFHKIYSQELDQAGGQPFGVLLGDYYFSYKEVDGVRDGIELLSHITKMAGRAFAPFVTSVSPAFFGVDSFSELSPLLQIEKIFLSPEYYRWRHLRQEGQSHFLALTLPRVLMRELYNSNGIKLRNRFFKEQVGKHEDYLWGNSAYIYGASIVQCVIETGWFSNITGQGEELNSFNSLLPKHYFKSDALRSHANMLTEFLLGDNNEKILSDAGFIAACNQPITHSIIFYSSQTVKRPAFHKDPLQATSAKINTLVHYVLCMSRFAHYIKVIVRDNLGSFHTVEACEAFISQWLNQYCSSSKGASPEAMIKKPLSAFQLSVKEMQDCPGRFFCSMVISPHAELDTIQSQLRMVTQIRVA